MLLPVREILSLDQPYKLRGELDMAEFVAAHTNLVQASPARVEAEAKAVSDIVSVQGVVDSDLKLVCSRCLKEFDAGLHFSFEEKFALRLTGESDEEDEDPFINQVTEDRVEFGPYVEEHIFMELPQFPVCSEHCKGLCPTCGTDRNLESCRCSEERSDPRWDGLKDWSPS